MSGALLHAAIEEGDHIFVKTDVLEPDLCPESRRHTKSPAGYVAWHNWAERKFRTHYQTRCPRCGFLSIWKKRTAPLTKEQVASAFAPGTDDE